MSIIYKLTRRPASLDDVSLELKKRGIDQVQIIFENKRTSNFDGPVTIREAKIKGGDKINFKVGDFDFPSMMAPSVAAWELDFKLHQQMLEERVVEAGLFLAQKGINVTVAGENLHEFVSQRFPEKISTPYQKER